MGIEDRIRGVVGKYINLHSSFINQKVVNKMISDLSDLCYDERQAGQRECCDQCPPKRGGNR